jgi:hypothetical protein
MPTRDVSSMFGVAKVQGPWQRRKGLPSTMRAKATGNCWLFATKGSKGIRVCQFASISAIDLSGKRIKCVSE